MSVITRFAPSPTGFLHIGGARTALFNWLYARRHGGRYLLRIEDTDRARSTQAAIDAILEGMEWLGLTPDEPVIYQFARAGRHREAAEEMIARGTAFRCYMSPEQIEQRRAAGEAARGRFAELKKANAPRELIEAAQAETAKLNLAFRSDYRDGGRPPSPNPPFVVRLRAPPSEGPPFFGEVVNEDLIQETVRIFARELDDLVLLRSDGSPTYMLSVVVDDHDMGITHVIRGDDHLTNAARQIAIYRAMDWAAPKFAHVPLIHGADGAKLSKRHGALGVEAYRELGYLPEGLAAYLIRLGWSPPTDDVVSLQEAAALFDLAQVVRSPARLDLTKLASVNAHFIKQADDARLTALTLDFIEKTKDWPLTEAGRVTLAGAMPILKQRGKTIAELAEMSFFFLRNRPIELDAAAQKAVKPEALDRLRRLSGKLEAARAWEASALAEELKAFAAAEGVGLGQIGPPLRAVLTGGAASPDLAHVLALLGREETLARISDQI